MNVSKTITDEIGRIVAHHTFNGAAPYGPGYMLCDGDIINQTNYDAQHGSGAYVRDQVALSPLNGKYVPNLVSKYLTGAASTTQTGGSAVTSVGNASHSSTTSGHVHSGPSHTHRWYNVQASGVDDNAWTSNGFTSQPVTSTTKASGFFGIGIGNGSVGGTDALALGDDMYTQLSGTANTGSATATVNVRPESIEVLYLIKVI